VTTGAPLDPSNYAWLKLWLDASDSSTLTLNPWKRVASWDDKSWNSNHVQADNSWGTDRRPRLVNGNLNGLDTIRFSSDDSLYTTNTSLIWANTDYTKFAVMKIDNSWLSNCTLGNYWWHTIYFATDKPRLYNQWVVLESATSIWSSNYAIMMVTYDPSVENTIYVNGNQTAANNLTRNFHDNGSTYVGSRWNSCFLNWKIAEVWIFDRGLDSSERNDLECYLSDKRNIPLSHGCFWAAAPILSNPWNIATPVQSSTVSFSFDSDLQWTIELYWSCSGSLQTPSNAQAVAGSNTITMWPMYNGLYNDCSVSVTTPTWEISNVLLLPNFEVTWGIPNTYIWSWQLDSPIMSEYKAGFEFSTNWVWVITLDGACSTSAVAPHTSTSGYNSADFAYLTSGYYDDCQISIVGSGWASQKYLLPPFTIVSWPQFSLSAQAWFNFSWSTSNQNQVREEQATDYFAIMDTKWLNEWRYTTVQASSLSGTNTTIPATNISIKSNGVALISWDANPDVILDPGLTAYQTLDQPLTYLSRLTASNQWRSGEYWTLPWLRLEIPAYAAADTYHGRIVFTIYED